MSTSSERLSRPQRLGGIPFIIKPELKEKQQKK